MNKNLYHYVHGKRLDKGNGCTLLKGAGDLVTADTDKAEVPSIFFVLDFPNKVSHTSVLRGEAQRGKLPRMDEDGVKDCLENSTHICPQNLPGCIQGC